MPKTSKFFPFIGNKHRISPDHESEKAILDHEALKKRDPRETAIRKTIDSPILSSKSGDSPGTVSTRNTSQKNWGQQFGSCDMRVLSGEVHSEKQYAIVHSWRERENIADRIMTSLSTLDCSVCGLAVEQASAQFCPTHARALDSVRRAYESWALAYGSVELEDFLRRIVMLQGTGRSVREIAEFLQQHPEKWKR